MIVVLPTPGPPVIIENLLPSERSRATDCLLASVNPARASHHLMAFAASTGRNAQGDPRILFTCLAVSRSLQYSDLRKMRRGPASPSARSATTRPSDISSSSARPRVSTGMPVSSLACRSRSFSEVQQCPSSSASFSNAYEIVARARSGESRGMPTESAILSAVAKPIPQMSRQSW